jgi:hypothetical protein
MSSNNGKPPDVVFLTLAVNNVTGLQNKLLELGYQGVLTNAVGYDRARPQNGHERVHPVQRASQRSRATPRCSRSSTSPGGQARSAPDAAGARGYLSADMFIQMLKKTGKNLTEARFLRERQTGTSNTS